MVLCKLASRNASRGATPALTVWLAAFAFRSMGDFTFTIRATMGNPEINFTAGPPQLRPAYGGGKQWRKVTCPGAPGCVHEEPCAEGFWIEDAKKDDPSYRSRQYNTHKNAKHGEVRTGALFASNTTMSPHRFMSPPRSLGSDPDESSRERDHKKLNPDDKEAARSVIVPQEAGVPARATVVRLCHRWIISFHDPHYS